MNEEREDDEVIEIRKGVWVWKGYNEWRKKFPVGDEE